MRVNFYTLAVGRGASRRYLCSNPDAPGFEPLPGRDDRIGLTTSAAASTSQPGRDEARGAARYWTAQLGRAVSAVVEGRY